MTKRMPVDTFTLSRSPTSTSLNVPKPFILTTFPADTASTMVSKKALENVSATFFCTPAFRASVSAMFWNESFSFIGYSLLSCTFRAALIL